MILLKSCAFASICDQVWYCGSLDSTEGHSPWSQVPNTAHLRSHAAGLCHVQFVVPHCLCLSMQGPTPQGAHCFLCLRLLFAQLHAKTYFLRPSLLPMFVCFSLLLHVCAIQRPISPGHHCNLSLQLLSALAHALDTKTNLFKPSLHPLSAASVCFCTRAAAINIGQ